MEKYQASLEAGLEELRQEAGKEEGGEKREEGLVCGGPERTTGCLACSRDKDVAHSLPDGRGRKGGGARQREHVPVAQEGRLLEREGSSGLWGEHFSLSWPQALAPVPLP